MKENTYYKNSLKFPLCTLLLLLYGLVVSADGRADQSNFTHISSYNYQSFSSQMNSDNTVDVIVLSQRENQSRLYQANDQVDSVENDLEENKGLSREIANQHFSLLQSQMEAKSRSFSTGGFENPRLRSMRVTSGDLDSLLRNPEISVYPNRYYKVSLAQSVPVVFAGQAASSFNGSGQAVALLDTGVQTSHSFLAGAILNSAAACFSNNNNQGVGKSLCPNGQGQQIGVGSGVNCTNIDGCDHGTHMAGIIAGSGNAQTGVATGATVIPIQVFTEFNNPQNPDHVTACGDVNLVPCIRTQTADVLRALEYINGIKYSRKIAAVNVSFGTESAMQGQCASALEIIANQITAGGVAVIASSGNTGNANAMTSPACIPSVISVAATNNSNAPWFFNDRSSELDFFAPGELINSPALGGGFSDVSGTSAAAGHVSGAWAVMKQKNPFASVGIIQQALSTTGFPVTQNSFTRPSIRIDAALSQLAEPVVDDSICFPVPTKNGKMFVVCL